MTGGEFAPMTHIDINGIQPEISLEAFWEFLQRFS